MYRTAVCLKNIANTCARAYVSDPKCPNCKNFLPYTEKNNNSYINTSLGKCKLFGHTQGNTFFPYYANSCRVHWLDIYCGKNGRFFEPN